MNRVLAMIFALCLFVPGVYAKKTAEPNVPEYFIEGSGTGTQGTYLVDVTVVAKNATKVNDDDIARAAVHGVLFKGFSNKELRQAQKPLAGSAINEVTHADFYENFFQPKGVARNYVEIVNSSRRVKKVGKVYHVTATVTVNKEQLRKDLEEAGVVKGLNSAF